MEYSSIIKFGRILAGLGFGTILGICVSGERAREQYRTVLIFAAIAIVVGLIMVSVTKNKEKLEQLQAPDNRQGKDCPSCGLSLSNDCEECPRCGRRLK